MPFNYHLFSEPNYENETVDLDKPNKTNSCGKIFNIFIAWISLSLMFFIGITIIISRDYKLDEPCESKYLMMDPNKWLLISGIVDFSMAIIIVSFYFVAMCVLKKSIKLPKQLSVYFIIPCLSYNCITGVIGVFGIIDLCNYYSKCVDYANPLFGIYIVLIVWRLLQLCGICSHFNLLMI